MSLRTVSLSLAVALTLTGCSAESSALAAYADTACASIIGNYNSWKVLDSETNRGEPGLTAASNFNETLEVIFRDTVGMIDYADLLKVNSSIQEGQTTFSAKEKLAGIVGFKDYSENFLQGQTWKPGDHVTLDGAFQSRVIDRCDGVTSANAESKPSASLSSFTSKNELFDAFLGSGGVCDTRIEDTNWRDICSSTDGSSQGSIWWNDQPLDAIPSPGSDIYIVYGMNWEVWISKEFGQKVSAIAESMGGTVIEPSN